MTAHEARIEVDRGLLLRGRIFVSAGGHPRMIGSESSSLRGHGRRAAFWHRLKVQANDAKPGRFENYVIKWCEVPVRRALNLYRSACAIATLAAECRPTRAFWICSGVPLKGSS